MRVSVCVHDLCGIERELRVVAAVAHELDDAPNGLIERQRVDRTAEQYVARRLAAFSYVGHLHWSVQPRALAGGRGQHDMRRSTEILNSPPSSDRTRAGDIRHRRTGCGRSSGGTLQRENAVVEPETDLVHGVSDVCRRHTVLVVALELEPDPRNRGAARNGHEQRAEHDRTRSGDSLGHDPGRLGLLEAPRPSTVVADGDFGFRRGHEREHTRRTFARRHDHIRPAQPLRNERRMEGPSLRVRVRSGADQEIDDQNCLALERDHRALMRNRVRKDLVAVVLADCDPRAQVALEKSAVGVAGPEKGTTLLRLVLAVDGDCRVHRRPPQTSMELGIARIGTGAGVRHELVYAQ
jgi:hypothetical protein